MNERAVKACLLLPEGSIEFHLMNRMMERALAPGATPNRAFFDYAKGMLEYRQGRFESALEWLQLSNADGVHAYVPGGLGADFFAAMAKKQLGRHAEAKADLAKLMEQMRQYITDEALYNVGSCPTDWLICDVARREAKALVFGATPETSPATSRPD
jgi:tetratricopeptide (TPR) repeat protein